MALRRQFDEQLKELNLEMVRMGGMVENAITAAVNGLVRRDDELNKKAIEADCNIDEMEKQIESRCLRIILQQQPVASDLRRVSAALKMITDMERIGDHAVDISEIALFLDEGPDKPDLADIPKMADEAVKMLTGAINAYVYNDEELAKSALDLLMIAKYMERIADHATNIAEWVVFSITGVHKDAQLI